MTNDKTYAGIWTPWAEVLCLECHGPTNKRTGEPMTIPAGPIDGPSDNEGICKCQKCGKQIAVRSDVADLRNLCDDPKLEYWNTHMDQTGGMCAAAVIQLGNPDVPDDTYPRVMVVPSEDGTTRWYAAVYRLVGEDLDDETWASIDPVMSTDDLVKKLRGLTFVHGGIAITNPYSSSCGRFSVDPEEEYGDAYRNSLWGKLTWE